MAFWPFSRRPSGGPKLCILHSGMPKTGSSALQRYLARNAGKLRRHGILYARAGRGMFRGVEHGDLMRSISERPLYANTGHLPAELDRELRRTAHDVLLISSEYLYSPLYFNRNQKIQTFFRERGYEIHSVLYIRDQPDFVNSAYAQMVKTLHEPGSFEHFLELRLRRDPPPAGRRLRLDHLLAPGLADWGTHHFRPYDREVRAAGIEPDFMAVLIGICRAQGVAASLTEAAARQFRSVQRANESCGPVQVEVSRRITRQLWVDHARRSWVRMVKDGGPIIAECVAAAGLKEPAYSGLTPERYARIRDALVDQNERFANEVWGRSWSEVFPARAEATLVSNDLDDHDRADMRALAEAIAAAALPKVRAHVKSRAAEAVS